MSASESCTEKSSKLLLGHNNPEGTGDGARLEAARRLQKLAVHMGCKRLGELHLDLGGAGEVYPPLAYVRTAQDVGQGKKLRTPKAPKAKKRSIAGVSPTARNIAVLCMRREEKLDTEQKEYLDRPCASDAALDYAYRLTQEFAKMVRGLEGEKLDEWLQETASSEAEVMRKFATRLKKDLAAVRAGLTEKDVLVHLEFGRPTGLWASLVQRQRCLSPTDQTRTQTLSHRGFGIKYFSPRRSFASRVRGTYCKDSVYRKGVLKWAF